MESTRRTRGVFCNRTLNLRGTRAIGYDMDYTLIHYVMEVWERRAYEYIKTGLRARGWPIDELEFDPHLAMRGLIIDRDLGNVVKANRFGYIKRACHGTRVMDYDENRRIYSQTSVDLADSRWMFLNTLFSISEACLYMQLVDQVDAGRLPKSVNYRDLYSIIRNTLDAAHAEGQLKAEILANPERFVDLDPEVPLALLDQKHAGKTLLLITNSEWSYAAPMLTFAFDRFLPDGLTWRDLFHVSFFAARKPAFFSPGAPAYEVISEDGTLREHRGALKPGGLYVGGNAALVEDCLGLEGGEILYVGDHLFVDVKLAKNVLRWRTALIIRELEDELAALAEFDADQQRISELMAQKEEAEYRFSCLRMHLQRLSLGYAPPLDAGAADPAAIRVEMDGLRERLRQVDAQIGPLAMGSGRLVNERWGPLFRTGNDKSHLARQVERYADIYTSRVSNFMWLTPFQYLRSPRGHLPHDP